MDCENWFHQGCCDFQDEFAKFGNPPDGVYLGVELELECVEGHERVWVERTCDCPSCRLTPSGYYSDRLIGRDAAAKQATLLLGRHFAGCKPDGSLNYGLELVTAPATYEYHKQRWERFFAGVPKDLEVKKTCGMHVHVSRHPLGPIVVGRLAVFVGNPYNSAFVNTIAGRSHSQYAKKWRKTVEAGGHVCSSVCYASAGSRDPHNTLCPKGRYEALNLLNEDTIEFRIFASTLDRDRFFANLGFVDSLRRFEASPEVTASHRYRGRSAFAYTTYCRWLVGEERSYPELVQFLSTTKFAKLLEGKAPSHDGPAVPCPPQLCVA